MEQTPEKLAAPSADAVTQRLKASLALRERWQSEEKPELEASLEKARAAKTVKAETRRRSRAQVEAELRSRLRSVASRHGETL